MPLWFCLFEGISYWVPHTSSEDRPHAMGIQWAFHDELVL